MIKTILRNFGREIEEVQNLPSFIFGSASYIFNKHFCYRENNVIESVYTQVQCPTHSIYYPQQTAARTTLFSTWVTGY